VGHETQKLTSEFSPFLFLATIVVAFIIMMGQSVPGPEYIKYSTVISFFQQDDPATDPSSFDYVGNFKSI
jgi:hypothetical protein